jgi:tetratricopeptide (TPR) repeat protein
MKKFRIQLNDRFRILPSLVLVLPCLSSLLPLALVFFSALQFSPDASGQNVQTSRDAERDFDQRRAEIDALIGDGIYTEAIRKLESHLEIYPNDIRARQQIAKAYLELGDYFRLRYHSRIILQNLSEDAQALAWREIAEEVIAVEYPIMVKSLLDALEKEPENTVLRRELIGLYVSEGESQKAAEQFRYLLEHQSDNEDLWLDYARNLSWMDELDLSLEAYEHYLEIAEKPRDVRLEIARVHAWNEQYGTAVNQLRIIIEEIPSNHTARALLADIFRWNDDSMAATEIYESILEEDPEHDASLRGLEELSKMLERRTATTATMNIEQMELKVKEEPESMAALLQLARLYGAANRYAEAASAFRQYLQNFPDDLPVRREYAFALSIEEEYDAAIQQLRLYLEVYPEDMPTHMRIVRMRMWQENYEAAKLELLEIEKVVPENAELQWSLGRIYEMEENWAQAIFHFEGSGPKVVTIEEIVSKSSWDSQDVEFLVEHEHLLDEDTLERLGITEPNPLTSAEVQKATAAMKKTKRPAAKETK